MSNQNLFLPLSKPSIGLFQWMRQLITELEHCEQFRTAQNYRNCMRSFALFCKDAEPAIDQLTPSMMADYQYFLSSKRICLNTISFYMRILRAVYNKAVKLGLTTSQDLFSNVYTGIAKTEKRAIKANVIRELKRLNLTGKHKLAFSRDLFLLSFYFRGMAFVDLVNLKKANIQNDCIRYTRCKTKQDLRVKIEPCAKAILEHYARSNSEYILPILNSHEPTHKAYDKALRLHNKRLAEISKLLHLSCALSSYVARHSWATLAKQNGVDLVVISESLGHTSLQTTQIYLDSLDQERIDDANSSIIALIG